MVLSPLGWAAAQSPEQLSPEGGIGNTRADFRREWGPLRQIGDPFVYERQEYVNYDTPHADIQLSVMYLLQEDARPRDTDRVGWLMISFVSSVSLSHAQRSVAEYLPEDAHLDRTLDNSFGEPREVYTSNDAKRMFPSLDIDGETIMGKGEIWVTYGTMGGSSVVAVEIGLYDDYA